MKLIFDENLSPKLVSLLAGEFPGCTHAETLGFKGDDDLNIWIYSKSINQAVIVSIVDDFREFALTGGHLQKSLISRLVIVAPAKSKRFCVEITFRLLHLAKVKRQHSLNFFKDDFKGWSSLPQ